MTLFLQIMKKKYSCNGTIKNDKVFGLVIQLSGDNRTKIKELLVES